MRSRPLRWGVRQTRLLAAVLVAVVVGLAVGPAILRDDAMAASRWQPFVAGSVPPADPPPAPGSAAERADLDVLLAIQAGRTPEETDAMSTWLGAAAIASWNDVLLQLVREDKLNPVRASRSLALLNVAMYDAIIAACREQVAHPTAAPRDRDGRIELLSVGRLDPEKVDEKVFARHLYVPELADADLVWRTSGEQRLSNFVLWQAAYSELVFTDVLWPDVDRRHLWQAVETYAGRDRRYAEASRETANSARRIVWTPAFRGGDGKNRERVRAAIDRIRGNCPAIPG